MLKENAETNYIMLTLGLGMINRKRKLRIILFHQKGALG